MSSSTLLKRTLVERSGAGLILCQHDLFDNSLSVRMLHLYLHHIPRHHMQVTVQGMTKLDQKDTKPSESEVKEYFDRIFGLIEGREETLPLLPMSTQQS